MSDHYKPQQGHKRRLAAVVAGFAALAGLHQWHSEWLPKAQYRSAVSEHFAAPEADVLREAGVSTDYAVATAEALRVESDSRDKDVIAKKIVCLSGSEYATPQYVKRLADIRDRAPGWQSPDGSTNPVSLAGHACDIARIGADEQRVIDIDNSGIRLGSYHSSLSELREILQEEVPIPYMSEIVTTDLTDEPRHVVQLYQAGSEVSYIDDMQEMGFDTVRDIINMTRANVTLQAAQPVAGYLSGSEVAKVVRRSIDTEQVAQLMDTLCLTKYEELDHQQQGFSPDRTDIVDQIIALSNRPEGTQKVAETLMQGEECGKPDLHRDNRFLEMLGESLEHGMDTTYIASMREVVGNPSSWDIMTLKIAGAQTPDVQRLVDAGFGRGDHLAGIIETGLVDYAVELGTASEGTVWGGYVPQLNKTGMSVETIAGFSRLGIAGEWMEDIHHTGATVEDISALLEHGVPITDQHVDDVWRAGIRPEMMPQLIRNSQIQALVEMHERGEMIEGTLAHTSPDLHTGTVLIRSARTLGLIE